MTRENENLARKEGGDSFTTFFFVGVALAALACFAAGEALRQRDALLAYVPADAVAYVHANGAEAARLAETSGARGFSGNEFATYAVERDGALEWIALSPAARGTRPRIALSRDRTARRALAAMRGLARLQAYVSPTLFGPPFGDVGAGRPPVVIGANARRDGYVAIVAPSEDAAKGFGFRAPTGRAPAPVGPRLASGPTTFSSAILPLAPYDLLFDGKNPFRTAPAYVAAETALRRLIDDSPVTVSLGAVTTLHFPEVPADRLAEAIERQVTAAWPSLKAVILPDGDTSRELVADPEAGRFMAAEGGWRYLEVKNGPHMAIAPAGVGSILALGAKNGSELPALTAIVQPNTCPGTNGYGLIRLKNQGELLESMPYREQIMAYFGEKSLEISQLGDNMVLICGYDHKNVDNIGNK
jgi:hypothetical protein